MISETDAEAKLGALRHIHYPVIGWPNNPVSLMVSQHTAVGVQAMPFCRKFHSIAALCGDGLRPELQALFERLAVDPHSELFVRTDGMVQSGPDPISVQTRSAQEPGEVESPDADSAPPRQASDASACEDAHSGIALLGQKVGQP
jgi:hypothetical protein